MFHGTTKERAWISLYKYSGCKCTTFFCLLPFCACTGIQLFYPQHGHVAEENSRAATVCLSPHVVCSSFEMISEASKPLCISWFECNYTLAQESRKQKNVYTMSRCPKNCCTMLHTFCCQRRLSSKTQRKSVGHNSLSRLQKIISL